jgi:predicted RecB family nuclease
MARPDPSLLQPEAAPRRRAHAPSWVSKSDVTSYLRCPYAFYQIDSGALSPTEAIDALGKRLIEEGVAFEPSITAEARPLPPEVDLAAAFLTEGRIYGLPLLRNNELSLRGVPDAVDAHAGGFVPVEIKSHREVRRTDELELAFYWRLLEPYRTTAAGPPRGRLILRKDGSPVEVEVRLTVERSAELDTVIDQVREARLHGVRPRICGCTVCSGPLRDRIAKHTWAGRDLTLIWGIARKIAVHLEELGISDFDALDNHDPSHVAASLCERRVSVSAQTVSGWSEHARSYREGRAVMFGPPPPVGESFISLDLEYGFGVWLTGVLVCDGDYREHSYFWADKPSEEREALLALEAVCATYPEIPVVTWAGNGADLPQLKYAATRHGLDHVYSEVDRRHIDLFRHAVRTMRIPHQELSLKAVADYFGIPKISNIANGLEAGFLYMQYRSSKVRADRDRRRAELITYNRDDLEATAAMVKIMRDGPARWPAARPNQWERQREQLQPLPRRLPLRVTLTREERVAARRARTASGEPPTASAGDPLNLPF